MAEEIKEAQKLDVTLTTVREKLYELAGVDPAKADNDEYALGAVNEFMEDIEGNLSKRAEALASDPARLEQIKAEVQAGIDVKIAADEILARADERRKAREEFVGANINRKGEASFDEATRAADDIVKQVESMQTKSLSGAMARALGSGKTLSGLLQTSVPEEHQLKKLQRANDDMMLVGAMLGVGGICKDRYPDFRSLNVYQKWHEGFDSITKALQVSDASAWAPTQYSTDLVETVFQTSEVAGLFYREPWGNASSTKTIPVEGTELTTYEAGEATTDDDDPKFTTSDIGVGTSLTVTARTLAARTVVSYELVEDSMVPMLPHIRMKFVRAFSRDLDQAILDGDADGTHQDTGRTLAAADNRKLFNGLRKKALADSPVSGATYFNAEQAMTPLLNMGAFGQPNTSAELPGNGTVGICSHAARLKFGFLRDTKDQRIGGSNAPITGPLGGLPGGYQLIGSEKVLSDLNTSGVFDNSTKTKTYLLWVYVPAWRFDIKADLRIQLEDRFSQGQYELAGRQRLAFTHLYASTATTTRMFYAFGDTTFA